MTVLELGGGFGGLAHFMAGEYGCRVVSYNISSQQVKYGRDWCRGLPVRFEEQDYREAIHEKDRFHRVVSIGLCEHIGYKNYRAFLELGRRLLKDEGLLLLHTIGGNQTVTSVDPWIDKYIFPNGMIPSVSQLGKAMEGPWVVEDWHNFGPDHHKTLLCWGEFFVRAWPRLRTNMVPYFTACGSTTSWGRPAPSGRASSSCGRSCSRKATSPPIRPSGSRWIHLSSMRGTARGSARIWPPKERQG